MATTTSGLGMMNIALPPTPPTASPSLSPTGASSSCRVLIHIASTGRSLEFVAPLSSRLLSVREELSKAASLPVNEQILLKPSGAKLNANATLSSIVAQSYYNDNAPSPSPSASSSSLSSMPTLSVFLYQRSHFSSTSTPPPFVPPTVPPITLPSTPAMTASAVALASNSSPLVKAVLTYEAQFDTHRAVAEAVIEGIDARIRQMHNAIAQQTIQLRAITAAINNLNGHAKHCGSSSDAFTSTFHQSNDQHNALIAQSESIIKTLNDFVLPNELAAVVRSSTSGSTPSPSTSGSPTTVSAPLPDGPMTLLSALNEGDIRQYIARISAEHSALNYKVTDVLSQADRLESLVSAVTNEPLSVSATDLNQYESAMNEWSSVHRSELNGALQTLLLDGESCTDFTKTLSRNAILLSENIISDKCALYERQSKEHLILLKAFENADERYRLIFQTILTSQSSLIVSYYEKVRSIAEISSIISYVESSIPLYTEALKRLSVSFNRLKQLQRIPSALLPAITETKRRLRFKHFFTNECKNITNKLISYANNERLQRQSFQQEFGQYLPRAIFSYLITDSVYAELNITEFDNNLPQFHDLNFDNNNDLINLNNVTDGHDHDDQKFALSSGGGGGIGGKQERVYEEKSHDDDNAAIIAELRERLAAAETTIEQMEMTASASSAAAAAATNANEHRLHARAAEIEKLQSSLRDSQLNSAQLEQTVAKQSDEIHRLRDSKKRAQQERQRVEGELKQVNTLLTKTISREAQLTDSEEYWKDIAFNRICLTDFTSNDLVLFTKQTNGHFQSFPAQSPSCWLATESQVADEAKNDTDVATVVQGSASAASPSLSSSASSTPSSSSSSSSLGQFFVGRVVLSERCVSGPLNSATNPYRLDPDTPFIKVTCERIHFR